MPLGISINKDGPSGKGWQGVSGRYRNFLSKVRSCAIHEKISLTTQKTELAAALFWS